MKTILILEDNGDRIAGFKVAVAKLGNDFDLKIWRDAPSMIAECEAFFPAAALISLDHDLDPPFRGVAGCKASMSSSPQTRGSWKPSK